MFLKLLNYLSKNNFGVEHDWCTLHTTFVVWYTMDAMNNNVPIKLIGLKNYNILK